MQITEQIRRTAVAWRTAKEQNNSTFLNLSTQVCMNARREEIISNAKINWELLRSHSKSLTDDHNKNNNRSNNINAVQIQKSDKFNMLKQNLEKIKSKGFGSLTSINENVEATKINIKKRSNSNDNLFRLKDTTKAYQLEFKLPPILDSIINSLINNKFEKIKKNLIETKTKNNIESLTSSDSEILESSENIQSCLNSHLKLNSLNSNNYISRNINKITNKTFESMNVFPSNIVDEQNNKYYDIFNSSKLSTNSKQNLTKISQNIKIHDQHGLNDYRSKSSIDSSGYGSLSSKTNSIDSCKSVLSDYSTSSTTKNINIEKNKNKEKRTAQAKKIVCYKNNKVAIARSKKKIETPSTPLQNLSKEREQGTK